MRTLAIVGVLLVAHAHAEAQPTAVHTGTPHAVIAAD